MHLTNVAIQKTSDTYNDVVRPVEMGVPLGCRLSLFPYTTDS